MATEVKGQKISAATEITNLEGNEFFPAAKNGTSGKVSTGRLKQYCTPDLSSYATKADLNDKQDKMKAGTGIEITSDNTINVTLDTTIYQVVTQLPTQDINPNKIYLITSAESEESNVYTEYIYVNGEWEVLGEYKAEVDLTPYLTKEAAQNTYQPKGNYLTEVPSEYVTDSELEETLNDYETSSHASSTFATKTELGNKLDVSTYNSDKATFATKAELNDKVSGTGLTSIQVVTELPSEQQDGVLYIVQEQESEEETA